MLVDQDMSAVEGVDSSSRSSWVRLEVSRLQNNYLTALTTTTTFERPIEGGANVSEHKAHAQGAESRQQKTPARPGNPAASLQAEAKGPIDRHGAAGPAQEKKTSDGDFELKSSLETVNAAIRPVRVFLTDAHASETQLCSFSPFIFLADLSAVRADVDAAQPPADEQPLVSRNGDV